MKAFFLSLLGSNGACSVHEWQGQFKNELVNFRMTSVCGHVMSLDFISKYNNWDRVDPVSMLQFFSLFILLLRKVMLLGNPS
jgi:hypothetical protein